MCSERLCQEFGIRPLEMDEAFYPALKAGIIPFDTPG
jgi:hypothetical protein